MTRFHEPNSSRNFLISRIHEANEKLAEKSQYDQFSCHGDSVRVLLEPGFQGHRYFQVVDAVNRNHSSEREAAVLLERAHAHQS